MKDWKVWALLIALYLIVKMCGGCNGCGSDSNISENNEYKKEEPHKRCCDGCGHTTNYGQFLNGKYYCHDCYKERRTQRVTFY